MENHSGFVSDAILLSIGRAILRKQEREDRNINDAEAQGHALVLQGRYGFVENANQELFCREVVRSFRYVEQRELQAVSKVAYAKFRLDELTGNSVLDDQLVGDLASLGYSA
ncbi:hypothetical protein [Pseudomonas aeruginosa]|uniref:hypothetical protein n=1 Tax=Pseudomonas aeruginosa TaxID=287 RepID=UPI0013EFC4E2|nr:hypothetical protein [Pseudomonas aeruginosa]MED5476569.1 hypothetical protein [Pseudomonadota bacterium]MCO3568090.1 hypothetical protein [Pseudomonas aeruginosa]MCP9250876.1 hypothetical protein [Pseudomonas aeruginosa]MDN3852905.1 hypothetical protein [Pseudomonas aeruginosa]MDP5904260.1 hypothetical protein [Pseudomonas aeruginosa]